MPNPSLAYYTAIADRMLPFLTGRKIAVEQRFPRSREAIYRRHEGKGDERTWIAIAEPDEVVRWARQYAVAFHAHLEAEDGSCWFVLDIDARDLPLDMARVAAAHALDVLAAADLAALVKFSGANGFHLMWNIPDAADIRGEPIWDLLRRVVVAVAREVERRLDDDPRAAPVRAAVGPDRPPIATSSQDEANNAAILFDEHILKPNVNVRAPFSLHPASGLVAVPIDRGRLERFEEHMAAPDLVVADTGPVTMPANALSVVQRALQTWEIEPTSR